jgi:hypothetical protein
MGPAFFWVLSRKGACHLFIRNGDYLERSIFGELDGLLRALVDAGPALDTFFGMDGVRFVIFHLIDFTGTDLSTIATTRAFVLIH